MDNEIERIPADSSIRRLSNVRKLWAAMSYYSLLSSSSSWSSSQVFLEWP